MSAPFLIVGQGLAGTALGWEFERAGFDFEIADPGDDRASSLAAAGIINPITGLRFVKSWRVDTLMPDAGNFYREIERQLAVPLVREMRIWRRFRTTEERTLFAAKWQRGDLAPFARIETTSAGQQAGFWIDPVLVVDLPKLISASRNHWLRTGRLVSRRVDPDVERMDRELVIVCTGADDLDRIRRLGNVTRAKGETLIIQPGPGVLDSRVIVNEGHWALPLATGSVQVGSTYNREAVDLAPTPESRAILRESARRLLGETGEVIAHLAGWRVSAQDRLPMIGRLSGAPRIGIVNGLGSKGAMFAPWLARQWMNHLTEAVPFDPAVDLGRFSAQ